LKNGEPVEAHGARRDRVKLMGRVRNGCGEDLTQRKLHRESKGRKVKRREPRDPGARRGLSADGDIRNDCRGKREHSTTIINGR